jgi:ribosomal protein S18 acetylase RimI-like enzyme
LSEATVSVRNISAEWADEIAWIHGLVLPSDIGALLGQRFLSRTFYPALIGSADSTVGAFEGGELVGYVVFSSDHDFYPKLLRKKFLSLIGAVLSRSLSPAFCRNAISVARYMLSASKLPTGSELAYIAVRPDFHGRGIGTQLVKSGFEGLRISGIADCWVKTLESTPENVRFYERLGFEIFSLKLGRVKLVAKTGE